MKIYLKFSAALLVISLLIMGGFFIPTLPAKAQFVATPVISSILPTSGYAGRIVEIYGSGFTSTNNTVNFGSTSIPALTCAIFCQLSFTIPSATLPGTYNVSVTNSNGTSNAMTFTLTSATTSTLQLTLSSDIPHDDVVVGSFVTKVLQFTGVVSNAPVTVTQLNFGMTSSMGRCDYVSNLQLYDPLFGGLQAPVVSALDSNCLAHFVLNTPFTIPAGSSTVWALRGNFSYSAPIGDKFSFNLSQVSTSSGSDVLGSALIVSPTRTILDLSPRVNFSVNNYTSTGYQEPTVDLGNIGIVTVNWSSTNASSCGTYGQTLLRLSDGTTWNLSGLPTYGSRTFYTAGQKDANNNAMTNASLGIYCYGTGTQSSINAARGMIVTWSNSTSQLSIDPASLANGEVGQDYSATISSMGVFAGNYSWFIASGALPPGLNLSPAQNSTVAIRGIPTKPGTYTFTIQFNTGNFPSYIGTNKQYTLTVDSTTTPNLSVPSAPIAPTPTSNRHARGLVVVDSTGTVFFLGAQVRYPFPNPTIFYSWGHKFSDVVQANDADLAIPTGPAASMK